MSILLIHGFWGTASHWSNTLLELQEDYAGKVTAIDIPLTSLADDVGRVELAIATAKAPVLLVGHSYGGAVITQAGNNDKVKGLVYIAAFAPKANESPASIGKQYPMPWNGRVIVDANDYLWLDPTHYRADMAADVSASEAFALSASQKPPHTETGSQNITKPAWQDKESWYGMSTHDMMIDPAAQKYMSERMGAHTVEIEASHQSLISNPKDVAALIKRAAKAVGI